MALIKNGTDVYIFSPTTDHQYLTNAYYMRSHTHTHTHTHFALEDIVYWNFNSPFPLLLKLHNKDLNPWYNLTIDIW